MQGVQVSVFMCSIKREIFPGLIWTIRNNIIIFNYPEKKQMGTNSKHIIKISFNSTKPTVKCIS